MMGYFFSGIVLMSNYSFLKKLQVMKFVKLGIFTLALGMFIASCGNNEAETTEEAPMEETTEMAPAVEEAPVAPVTTDSTATAPATEAAPSTEAAPEATPAH